MAAGGRRQGPRVGTRNKIGMGRILLGGVGRPVPEIPIVDGVPHAILALDVAVKGVPHTRGAGLGNRGTAGEDAERRHGNHEMRVRSVKPDGIGDGEDHGVCSCGKIKINRILVGGSGPIPEDPLPGIGRYSPGGHTRELHVEGRLP